ncbi:MAG: lipid-A-disaccharide synthase [Verrucomicrobia bacterium A1]|nr:MAG: lipid-A-disaccharide synthase [Verrucomicrobia bacterium A1]
MSRSVLVIAGEVSGDLHAGALAAALRAQGADLALWGIGGDRLRAEGAELLYDVRQTAVMGFVEVLRHLGFLRRVFRHVLGEVDRRRPSVAILVDYPGFNLRLAPELRKRGVKVVYYVCPQVWAWHRSRIGSMARTIDRLAVIFPFEVDAFRDTGLRVDYVGHPLVDETAAALRAPPAALPWRGAGPRIALLPGSRRQEIRRILPALAGAAGEIARRHPDASFLLAAPSEPVADIARGVLAGRPGADRIPIVTGVTREVLRQARAAWVASGTATMEACLMGCPQAVVYRTHPLSYRIGKALIRVPHIGMVNLVAGRGICPELIQHEATPGWLAEAVDPLLGDTPQRAAMLAGYAEVRAKLGGGGAAERAAAIVLDELAGTTP